MIAKYRKDNSWCYIGNVIKAETTGYDQDDAVRGYEKMECAMSCTTDYQDPCEYMNGKRLDENIIKSNKAFMYIASMLESDGTRHDENLLEPYGIQEHMPCNAILLCVEDCKEYDAIALITNQTVYLMNDKGQTIERLN